MTKTEEVNELLKKLPLAPTGVEKWVHEHVVENAYIIFNNKQNEMVCTRCGKHFSRKYSTNVKHNTKTHCPKCGTEAIYKAKHYGRKNLTEYFRVLLLTHRGKTVYGTLFEITAEFEPYGRPILSKWLSALYVFKENEQHYYKHYPGWGYGYERWEEKAQISLPHPPRGSFYYAGKFERTELYMDNLENVFTKSCLKYHYDRDFFDAYEITAYEMIPYISQSLNYPAIELLRKAGFERLVINRIDHMGPKHAINIRGKNLKVILRLPKRWHRKVKEQNLSLGELYEFQRLDEQTKGVADQEFLQECLKASWYREDIEHFVPMAKAVRYVGMQHGSISMYRDYLEAAYEIGEDIDSKKVLYPKDLRTAHDRAVSMRKVQRDVASKRSMEETVMKLLEEFPKYEKDGFLVRVAESQQELNDESQALTHCVRTYGEKMAKGQTMIFFVRKATEPDKPYYTLELSTKRTLLQCRGDHNCAMTEEVKTFVDGWLEYIRRKPKKKKEAA